MAMSKEEIQKQKQVGAAIVSKIGTGTDIVRAKDQETDATHLFILGNGKAYAGAFHYIHTATGDIRRKGCMANGTQNYGKDPNNCLACAAKEMGTAEVDVYRGKIQPAEHVIIYWALVGKIKLVEGPDGQDKPKAKFDNKLVPYQVSPSMYKDIHSRLGDLNVGNGDITQYLWKLEKTGTGADTRYKTEPFMQDSKIVSVPEAFQKLIAEADLKDLSYMVAPSKAEEMSELLGVHNNQPTQPSISNQTVSDPVVESKDIKQGNKTAQEQKEDANSNSLDLNLPGNF